MGEKLRKKYGHKVAKSALQVVKSIWKVAMVSTWKVGKSGEK